MKQLAMSHSTRETLTAEPADPHVKFQAAAFSTLLPSLIHTFHPAPASSRGVPYSVYPTTSTHLSTTRDFTLSIPHKLCLLSKTSGKRSPETRLLRVW